MKTSEQQADRLRSPRIPQIWRMQRIIEWLREERTFSARHLTEEFQVSRRTIAGDLDHLRVLGVPVEFDARRRSYVLSEPVENLPLLPITRTEMASFLVARYALEALGDESSSITLEAVASRLAAHMPATIRIDPDALSRSIRFDPGPQPHASLRFLNMLESAARDQRVVRIGYYSNYRDETTQRSIEPYTILWHRAHWYAVSYCRLRRAMRDFRIDRIKEIALTDDSFAIPDDFNLDAYLGPAFGIYRDERPYPVHLRFSSYQSRWIREERWHESQIMLERADGSLDVMMQVTGLSDLTRWVLSYGAECEVISPPVLRRRVASEARKMTSVYENTSATEQ